MTIHCNIPGTAKACSSVLNSGLNGTSCFMACILSVLFCLLSSHAVYAEKERGADPKYIFYKGNSFYEEGKYDLAVREYSKLLDQGMESGNLYYNIGNCYVKMGDIGGAVLNYERAYRLIPLDSDLRSNYDFARSHIKYATPEISPSWYQKLFAVFESLSVNEMTVLLSTVFVIIILFLTVRLYIYSFRRYSFYFISVSMIIFVVTSAQLVHKIALLDKEAVIISESAEARFEPFENATAHFTLYEGMKVEIIQSKKEWDKVRRQDGKEGWIKSGDMEKV